jgi:hypothetical protein
VHVTPATGDPKDLREARIRQGLLAGTVRSWAGGLFVRS